LACEFMCEIPFFFDDFLLVSPKKCEIYLVEK